jgi:hypothetical protein
MSNVDPLSNAEKMSLAFQAVVRKYATQEFHRQAKVSDGALNVVMELQHQIDALKTEDIDVLELLR